MVNICNLPTRAHAGQRSRPRANSFGAQVKVLIIDDDDTTRLALGCMAANERYDIVLASSAEQALECLGRVEPDLVLCDFLLDDGIDGRQLCKAFRRNARWRHVSFVIVTCIKASAIIADLLACGADDVILKPVRGEELRARMDAALHARVQRSPHVASYEAIANAR